MYYLQLHVHNGNYIVTITVIWKVLVSLAEYISDIYFIGGICIIYFLICFSWELHKQATEYRIDLEFSFSNDIDTTQIYWTKLMGTTMYDLYRYFFVVVFVFGILGNILVIISILRQKKVMKNNYYFLVLHLAMCDLGAVIIFLFDHIKWRFVEEQLDINSTKYCVFYAISYVFQTAGIGIWCWSFHCFVIVLHCYCTSLKTRHQSTEIESRLWFSVHCWFYCRLWSISTVMFYAWERCPNCLF